MTAVPQRRRKPQEMTAPTQGGMQGMQDPRAQMMQQMAMGGMRQGMQGQQMGMQGAGRTIPGLGINAQQLMQMAMKRRMQQTQQSASGPQPYMGTGLGKDDPVRLGQTNAPVDSARVKEAMRTMMEYKQAKHMTDERITRAQEWWRQRNWQEIELERGVEGTQKKKSNTGWLKTSIVGKHADYMEAYPEPLFLARNEEDEGEAQHLSEIVPVILKQIGFEETYSQVGWQKIVEGTGVYGITWDGRAQHGMGDICIRKVNVLNIYTEPGIEDIQDSANVFLVRLEDNKRLEAMYPQLAGKLGTPEMQPNEYKPIDEKNRDNQSLVVDWYYKKPVNGQEVLHYCKFVGDNVLYASENDPQAQQRGHYHHGLYPFVVDTLLPDAETIWGQGIVDEAKDTQMDIDIMSQAMVTNATANATPRYFERSDSGINREQFLDWSNPLIETNGNLGEDSIRRMEVPQMDGNTLSFYSIKVEELKSITGNTEVMNGDVPSGVTSGVAIAALKEDAGRSSKDSNRASYRAMQKLYLMVVELMRQFYTMDRQFRIVGEDGMARYMHYTNAGLMMQTQMTPYGVSYRMPLFDVDVHVQRENAYTRMALNDLATQFYNMGLFNPMAAPQALAMLKMMEFTGKEKMVRLIQQNFMQTMAQMGGTASHVGQQPQQQGVEQKDMQSTPTEEDATEAGKGRNSQAHTPATDRMQQRVNDAVRP